MPKSASSTAAANPSPKNTAGFRSRRQSGPAVRQSNAPATTTGSTPATPSSRSAPPLPKRNKGRFFVGTIFFSVLAAVAYIVWTTFFQYQSYGVIQGRLITVSAPWDGVVLNWQIKDGEEVQQGQALAEISNLEMRHSLESLMDDLKLTQAQLDAEAAKLKFQQQSIQTVNEKTRAEYLQAFGDLEAEESQLADLRKQLDRARKLIKSRNFSQQKYDKIYFAFIGEKRKFEKSKQAVAALKTRHELSEREHGVDRQQQIKPMLMKIETIQAEISRLRQKIQQGTLVAPINGRVTKRLCLTGESIAFNEPIVEILESNSTEAILYVPQEHANRFEIGETIAVNLPPYEQNVQCEIVRLREQLESPPKHIERFYTKNAVLLPVHLKPLPEYEHFMSFRINGLIKLPVEWRKNLKTTIKTVDQGVRELFSSDSKETTNGS